MRNRFYFPAVSSALLLFSISLASAADGPPLRLWLKNGSFVDGHLDATGDNGLVGFKSELFRGPLYFDVRAIRSVAGDVSSNDQLSDHFFLIEGGTRVAGKLKEWNDKKIVVQSPSLGEVRLERGLLRSVEASEDGGKRIYSGPRSLDDWQILDSTNNWRFAAGSLSRSTREPAVGDVGMPDKFRLSLSMSWEGRADFVLSLGCNQPKQAKQIKQLQGRRQVAVAAANDGAAVRLEMWDAQLAIVREIGNLADIAVLPLDDGLSRFDMTFYVDQIAGLVAVYSSRGRLLEKIQVADDKGKARSFAMLENHGKKVSLDRFDVYSWDGHLPSSTEYPESYVLDKAEKIVRGDIQGFDAESGTLRLRDKNGRDAELALLNLRRVVVADSEPDDKSGASDDQDPKQGDRSRLIEIEFADSSRVIGTLASADGAFVFNASGIEGELKCLPEKVVAIIGSETRFADEDVPQTVGTLSSDKASLKGYLTDNPNPDGDAVLIWQPLASPSASPIARTANGSIRYPKPKRSRQVVRVRQAAPKQEQSGLGVLIGGIFGGGQAKPAAKNAAPAAAAKQQDVKKYEIVFQTGDTVDGVVQHIDSRGVTFQSDETTTKFVPHEKMDSLVLNTLISKVKFDGEKMKRLMTVPRSMKNDPPTHLFLARTGDYLRGRLLAVDQENVTVEIRLANKQIPRSKIARIVWLHDRPWLDKEGEEGKGDEQQAEDKGDSEDVFLVHAVRPDKRGVTFAPKKVVEGKLMGESDLLGECSVSLDGIESLLFGTDVGRQALELRQESWTLALATLPKVYQETENGEGPAMGLQSPLVGRDAPGIQLDTIDGDAFDLASLRGKVVVLDFWASWCGPCIQTMPEVDRIVEEMNDEDIQLVAVNLQDSVERAKLAVERMNLKATVIMDVDGEAGRYYDARAIPQTVIVDREGKITHLFVGGGAKFLDQFATALKSVVAGEQAKEEADSEESS